MHCLIQKCPLIDSQFCELTMYSRRSKRRRRILASNTSMNFCRMWGCEQRSPPRNAGSSFDVSSELRSESSLNYYHISTPCIQQHHNYPSSSSSSSHHPTIVINHRHHHQSSSSSSTVIVMVNIIIISSSEQTSCYAPVHIVDKFEELCVQLRVVRETLLDVLRQLHKKDRFLPQRRTRRTASNRCLTHTCAHNIHQCVKESFSTSCTSPISK